MDQLEKYLIESASRHHQLCPRQVLGVRMGLYAGQLLDLRLPRTDKGLLTISETDGCFVSGISVTTGCRVSRRTLRIEDYGKVAATFIRVQTKQAFRIAPRSDVRQRAYQYAPHQTRRYYAQLEGYQVMPDDELFSVHQVSLSTPVENLIGRPGVRVNCENCGEEIINQREVFQDGQLLCKSCASESNYYLFEPSISMESWSSLSPVDTAVPRHSVAARRAHAR
jgi:formylmethanofuran dehydrogenase subunit E